MKPRVAVLVEDAQVLGDHINEAVRQRLSDILLMLAKINFAVQ